MWLRRVLVTWLALTLLLAGCWDRRELEDQAYIILLGIDRAPGSELFVTALVADVSKLSIGAMTSSVNPPDTLMAARVLTARAATVTQAVHVLNGGMTRNLELRHMRGVVVGESLAREGLEPVLMEIHRHPLARVNVLLAQASGMAYEVISAIRPVGEVNPARVAEGYLLQAKSLHLAPPIRLHNFLSRLASTGGDPYLPLIAVNPEVEDLRSPLDRSGPESSVAGEMPRAGGNPVEMVGSAIFRRDRLAGYLNVDQTQMLLAMKGSMGKAYMSFPDPDHPEKPVTMRFQQENFPEVKTSMRGSSPSIHMAIKFEGELLAVPGGTDFTDPAARQRLEQAAGNFAKTTMRQVVDRLVEWGADPIGLGNRYRGRFSSWAAWEAFDWPSRVRDMELTVQTTMRVRRFGLYTGPDSAQTAR